MAIVTISRIKNRRGLMGVDPMPQLASAELGWGIDKRELYIGNGTLEEGAPVEGNTLIMTEHTDLISYLNNYIYEGPFVGADMETWPLSGPNINTPIRRGITDRLDDMVSVRAFGGIGDGTTDNSDMIERAITQLYTDQPTDNQYWDELHFPAGTYRITRPIQIPKHARIVGDGIDATIFLLDAPGDAVANITKYTHDEVDYTPEDIHISKLSFRATDINSDALIIGDATDITFREVGLIAFNNDIDILGTYNAALRFSNESSMTSKVLFDSCKFSTATFGIVAGPGDGTTARQDIYDILVTNSKFDNLYQGFVLGDAAATGYAAPKSVRAISNTFDNVTKEGIYVYKGKFFTSSHNHFADVGNDQGGAASASCIIFGDYGAENPAEPTIDLTEYQGNYSIGDTFDRTDLVDKTVSRIKISCLKSYVIDPDEIHYGTLHIEPGRLIMLENGQILTVPTGLTLDKTKYQGAFIDYQINRSSESHGELRRTGTIRIAQDTTSHSFSEEYDELGAVGISLSSSDVSNYTSIDYSSTGSIGNAIFSYSISHVTCIGAYPSVPFNIPPILDTIGSVYNLAPPMIPTFDPMITINAEVSEIGPTLDLVITIDAEAAKVEPTLSSVTAIDAAAPAPIPGFTSLNAIYGAYEDEVMTFGSLTNIYGAYEDEVMTFGSLTNIYGAYEDEVMTFGSLTNIYQGIVDTKPIFGSLTNIYQGIVDTKPIFDSLTNIYQGYDNS